MRDAAGEVADRLHLLRLPDLCLGRPSRGCQARARAFIGFGQPLECRLGIGHVLVSVSKESASRILRKQMLRQHRKMHCKTFPFPITGQRTI